MNKYKWIVRVLYCVNICCDLKVWFLVCYKDKCVVRNVYIYLNMIGVWIFNIKFSLICMLGLIYCMFEFNFNMLYLKKYCIIYILCCWWYDEKKIIVYFVICDIVCNDLNFGIF